jgi:TonB-linked SusC/RagA family outer membrane protein
MKLLTKERAMLIVLFLFVGCIGLKAQAQEQRVTVNVENKTLKELFSTIEKQTTYRFAYRNVVLDNRKDVTIHQTNASVSEILSAALSGRNLDFSIVSAKSIVISDKKQNPVATDKSETKEVSGIVTDADGEVIGASVVEKGTSNGTATDLDGRYTLRVSPNAILEVTYIGYVPQEIAVTGRTNINVTLNQNETELDEFVVVGYGTQKKINLTGAVSTVSAAKLESRATTNLSTALSGLASGVTVRQGSGKPGDDEASIRIRGFGTFSSSYLSPLIIVDGSEASIGSVNSEDVETISFLKDAASAAIYGSRGANGVLLITTKRGKKGEKPNITYTGLYSDMRMSGKAFTFENNYAEYMEMANRWNTNVNYNAATKYSQNDIDEWRTALTKDPNSTDNRFGVPNYLAYPSTQWVDHLFLPSSSQKHNLSVSGASDNTTYLMSFGYLDNPGTLQNTAVNNYSGRINLESKINKFLKVGTQTYATFQKREPGNTGLSYMFQNTPAMTPYHDGMYGVAVDGSSSNNLLASVLETGGSYDQTRLNTTWYAGLNIIEGLTAEVRYNYQTMFNETATFSKKVDRINFRTGEIRPGVSSTTATTTRATTRYWNNTLSGHVNYQKTIGNHDFAAMLGTEKYYWTVKGFSASRTGLLDLDLPDFTVALDKVPPVLGGTAEQDYAVVSYFGRINYAYNQRYLLEANFRRDGSSRFGPNYRWGTFPSFSAGWRVSEEEFFAPAREYVNNLKLRGSWGQLGNTTSGYYEWQATYGPVNYSLDGNIYDGLRQGKLANPVLHWESVSSGDIGLEAGFLNSRLSLEADYYNRLTKGILATPSSYLTMGTVSPPTTNTSDMRNQGVEFMLTWSDKIKDFQYRVSANFAYNKNEVVTYKGKFTEGWVTDENGNRTWVTNRGDVADVSGNSIVVEGHAYNEYYMWKLHSGNGNIYLPDGVTPDPNGGPRDGIIRTKADLDWARAMLAYKDANGKTVYNLNNQSVGQNSGLWYGEAVYADLNGDGMYGTNDNDRYFTGKSSMPKYTFGLNLSAAWKGFDINMTWAGQAGIYYHIYERGFNNMSSANWQEGTIIAKNARNIYYYCDPKLSATDPNYDPATDPNANINAPYLRIGNIAHHNNTSELYNASYIKLKTLQVGYTFPKAWIQKAYVNNLRLFVSGENLLTITDFPGVDPEMGGNGFQSYPIPRMFSGGINITF